MPTARVLPRHHHRLAHHGVGRESVLDLDRLHPMSPDLHLLVEATEELDRAVGAIARQVAGPVEALGGLVAHGSDAEVRRGQLRIVPVAPGQSVAGDVKLAGHAHRAGLPVSIEDVDAGVLEGAADGDAGPERGEVGDPVAAGEGGALGGPVAVDDDQAGMGGEDAPDVGRRHHVAAREQLTDAGQAR